MVAVEQGTSDPLVDTNEEDEEGGGSGDGGRMDGEEEEEEEEGIPTAVPAMVVVDIRMGRDQEAGDREDGGSEGRGRKEEEDESCRERRRTKRHQEDTERTANRIIIFDQFRIIAALS